MIEEIDHLITTFLDYLAKMQQGKKSLTSKIQLDGIPLVMYTEITGINLAVVHAEGVWATDENTKHDVILVYKGSGDFSPTEEGIFDSYSIKIDMFLCNIFKERVILIV